MAFGVTSHSSEKCHDVTILRKILKYQELLNYRFVSLIFDKYMNFGITSHGSLRRYDVTKPYENEL